MAPLPMMSRVWRCLGNRFISQPLLVPAPVQIAEKRGPESRR
jgi:hypothetical protein